MTVKFFNNKVSKTAEEAAEADRIIIKMIKEAVVEIIVEMAAENETE